MIGNREQEPASGFRVCPHWQSWVDKSMQRPFSRERRHDFRSIGMHSAVQNSPHRQKKTDTGQPVTSTSSTLSQQVNRLGHHIRQTIVEEAKAGIVDLPQSGALTPDGNPEPIPKTQAEYHTQADAALRDLFPRIPNTDRQMIIDHAFTRVSISNNRPLQYSLTNRNVSQRANPNGDLPVGFSGDIPLARRVQLAVLAHIRHLHTRYDELLKEAGWQAARKAVETLCLDILVKWRGDEETGRDQLDEILREVVVISDSEDDSSDEETIDDSSTDASGSSHSVLMLTQPATGLTQRTTVEQRMSPGTTTDAQGQSSLAKGKAPAQPVHEMQRTDRRNQRGFKRYRAWEEAIMRSREAEDAHVGFTGVDTGEYDPRHAHIPARQFEAHPSMAYNSGQVERVSQTIGFNVSSGLHPQAPPLYSRPVGTPPRFANHPAEFQAPHEDLGTSMYVFPTDQTSSSRVMSPITNRLRDMAVPSIEPASPEGAMRPAFVRPVPPRQQDHLEPLPARTHAPFHTIRSVSPMDNQIRNSPDRGGRRVISDHLSERRLQPSNFAPEPAIYAPRERVSLIHPLNSSHAGPAPLPGWTRSYEQPIRVDPPKADRIIVNASRPGTRTNPILMEDRGGFYERVPLPPEPRPLTHQDDASLAHHGEPYRATESYRVVSSAEGARILQNNRNNPDVEVIPIRRPGASQQSEHYYGHHVRPYQRPVLDRPDSYQFVSNDRDVGARDVSGHHMGTRAWPAQAV